jgi:hypothetical protein
MDAPKVKILMFFVPIAKNYPGFLRDQNKYVTFRILANPIAPVCGFEGINVRLV